MNTISHLRLSLAIKDAIESDLGIKLDTVSFMIGNTKPDFSPHYFKIPHLKDGAMNFISSEIKSLMKYKISKNSTCTKRFSERLGVITHYLADFFCFAHSYRFGNNMIKHVIYEDILSRYSKTKFKAHKKYTYKKITNYITDYNVLCDSIDRFHKKYELKQQSFATDTAYILSICTFTVSSIITSCMSETREIAA